MTRETFSLVGHPVARRLGPPGMARHGARLADNKRTMEAAPILSSQAATPRLPREFLHRCRQLHIARTRFVLVVRIRPQRMDLFERRSRRAVAPDFLERIPWEDPRCGMTSPQFLCLRRFLISTSKFGIGQHEGSNRTPLGLHRVREKIGGGWPAGTVFKSRGVVGFTWQGLPKATIAHRILWLEGLEPGFNRGGSVDTHARYIYIHGLADEPTLGRPASHGCIHLAADDLIPLFDQLPDGTLVWIQG